MEAQSIEFLASQIKKRVRKDFDLVTAITGEEGIGKSVFAIELAKECDPNFTLEKNELITPNVEKMKEKITQLPQYSCIIADEAIRILYKQQWYTKAQIYLNQLFSLCRQENKIVLLCIPRFMDINSYFRTWRIKFWVNILERGTAVLFGKDWSQFCKEPWHLDENQKMIEQHRKRMSYELETKIGLLSKLHGYSGVIQFDDLDEETKNQYLEVKKKSSYEDLEKIVEEKPMGLRFLKQRIALGILTKFLNEIKITQTEIGKVTGIPQETLSKLSIEGSKYLQEHPDIQEHYASLIKEN